MPGSTKTRNDSILDTGMTSAGSSLESANARRVAAKQEEKQRERSERRGALTPSADIIVEWIDKERALVIEELAKLPVTIETSEENVKSTLLAVKMHLDFLTRMRLKTKNVLRMAKTAERKADQNAPQAWKDAANSEDA